MCWFLCLVGGFKEGLPIYIVVCIGLEREREGVGVYVVMVTGSGVL